MAIVETVAAPAAPAVCIVAGTAETPVSMTATDQGATIRAAGRIVVPMPVDLVVAAARVKPSTPIDGACPRKSAPRAPPAI